jgi:mRNA interferase HigB
LTQYSGCFRRLAIEVAGAQSQTPSTSHAPGARGEPGDLDDRQENAAWGLARRLRPPLAVEGAGTAPLRRAGAGYPLFPVMGTCYEIPMQIIAKQKLRQFLDANPRFEAPLKAWRSLAAKADWTGPADVKRLFGASVAFVESEDAVFEFADGQCRLVVQPAYSFKRVLIKFVEAYQPRVQVDPETA